MKCIHANGFVRVSLCVRSNMPNALIHGIMANTVVIITDNNNTYIYLTNNENTINTVSELNHLSQGASPYSGANSGNSYNGV